MSLSEKFMKATGLAPFKSRVHFLPAGPWTREEVTRAMCPGPGRTQPRMQVKNDS